MFIYIFPIFAFGLVITGIVFLGLQQASDMAKELAADRSEAEKRSANPETAALPKNPAAAKLF